MTPGLWLPFSWAFLISTLDVFPLDGLGCWKRGRGRELRAGGVRCTSDTKTLTEDKPSVFWKIKSLQER